MSTQSMRSYSRCVSFCTANSYDLLGIASYFKKRGYHSRISRDALHIQHGKKNGHLFFFHYGCFVSWGFKKAFEDKVLEVIKDFSIQPLTNIEVDYLYYGVGTTASIDIHEKYRLDIITLATEEANDKLAISYGLAQSIKLEAFEEAIKEAIKKNAHLPEEIATKGVISLSRRAIFKRMGEIFIARSSINLNIEYMSNLIN